MTIALILTFLQVVAVDLLLSGDNALVIAMATRGLGDRQNQGIVWGTVGAIVLRIVGALLIGYIVHIPYLGIAGAAALMFVAIKMVVGGDDADDIPQHDRLWDAILTIMVADFTMSLDNIIAITGTSGGNPYLMVFGILFAIPTVMIGATVIAFLIEKLPWIMWLGGMLLGAIAGGMIADDKVLDIAESKVWLQVTLACMVPILAYLFTEIDHWKSKSST